MFGPTFEIFLTSHEISIPNEPLNVDETIASAKRLGAPPGVIWTLRQYFLWIAHDSKFDCYVGQLKVQRRILKHPKRSLPLRVLCYIWQSSRSFTFVASI
eukprot:GHVP01008210.1.p1 GENE.GHVP01008210.1~~GHVP01008210.1.p1  ORF type:complete len:100 (-),score=13.83 GHVP01008210.1:113-412(-)